jgi:Ca2+-binding EF-hand superfamily protein
MACRTSATPKGGGDDDDDDGLTRKIIKVFRSFDMDGDGAISRDELTRLLQALNRDKWTNEELEVFMKAADMNGDGLIQYEEFVHWVSHESSDQIMEAGESVSMACPPGMHPCKFGMTCFNKDPRHRKRFWHPPPPVLKDSARSACRYGSGCFQTSRAHLEAYAHPGDRNYRLGLVSFGRKGPHFETMWQLFSFCDPNESGHLSKEEFANVMNFAKMVGCRVDIKDLDKAWFDAGGEAHGYVNFGRFSQWAEAAGMTLPIGIEAGDDSRPCHFRIMKEGGWSCGCKEFQQADDSFLCECGHKPSMHRSTFADRSTTSGTLDEIPSKWEAGREGLVEVSGDIHGMLNDMLNSTHKTSDNWTRDRGCKIHGRGHPDCSHKCIKANGWPVPTGYSIKRVFRNQNQSMWKNYSLMRTAIAQECKEDSAGVKYEDVSIENKVSLDTELQPGINEWRLFHGTKIAACRGICGSNFRLALSGTGATWKEPGSDKGSPLYGFGIYLAERITKADEYADPLPDGDEDAGLSACLIVRCIGGRPNIVTTNDIEKEKLKMDVFDGPYHSVFGDRVVTLGKPYREIVVYDKDQIYPEFLVIYERRYD